MLWSLTAATSTTHVASASNVGCFEPNKRHSSRAPHLGLRKIYDGWVTPTTDLPRPNWLNATALSYATDAMTGLRRAWLNRYADPLGQNK
jgi:hypothetical protein